VQLLGRKKQRKWSLHLSGKAAFWLRTSSIIAINGLKYKIFLTIWRSHVSVKKEKGRSSPLFLMVGAGGLKLLEIMALCGIITRK